MSLKSEEQQRSSTTPMHSKQIGDVLACRTANVLSWYYRAEREETKMKICADGNLHRRFRYATPLNSATQRYRVPRCTGPYDGRRRHKKEQRSRRAKLQTGSNFIRGHVRSAQSCPWVGLINALGWVGLGQSADGLG